MIDVDPMIRAYILLMAVSLLLGWISRDDVRHPWRRPDPLDLKPLPDWWVPKNEWRPDPPASIWLQVLQEHRERHGWWQEEPDADEG